MSWADRVGDLASNIALVLINFCRIFTVLMRSFSTAVDSLVTRLAEVTESGISPTKQPDRAWTHLPASVLWGIATVALRLVSIVTVFVRQVMTTLDEFFRELSEGAITG